LNEAFLKALDDENLDVREAAADMMLFIESPNIIDSLAKSMQDPNEDIRDMALITLEDIPDKRSVDVLIQYGLLNDNETIREDALDSIEWITDMEFENYESAREWWDAHRDNFEFDD
jgi:HEAT repeat protein